MKKFELTDERLEWKGYYLYRTRSLADFTTITGRKVKAGDLGGFLHNERTLSQEGRCWVADDAKVYQEARVYGDAEVNGRAQAYEWARVRDSAIVRENSEIYGWASANRHAEVLGHARLFGDAIISDYSEVGDHAKIYGRATITGAANILGDADISSNCHILNVSPIYQFLAPLTMFRNSNCRLSVVFEGQLFSAEQFKAHISDWNLEYRIPASLLLEVAEFKLAYDDDSQEWCFDYYTKSKLPVLKKILRNEDWNA